jgi:hypothetical protein
MPWRGKSISITAFLLVADRQVAMKRSLQLFLPLLLFAAITLACSGSWSLDVSDRATAVPTAPTPTLPRPTRVPASAQLNCFQRNTFLADDQNLKESIAWADVNGVCLDVTISTADGDPQPVVSQ